MTTRREFFGSATAVGAMTFPGAARTAPADAGSREPGRDPAARRLRARTAIFAVDTDTRRNYDALRAELIKRLGPVVVVENDYRGGRYTLVHHGEQESVHPVCDIFELAKSVAHAPLGIYSIIAPYLDHPSPDLPGSGRLDPHDLDMVAFKGPATLDWLGPLQAFGATLATARQQVCDARMPHALEASSTRILDASVAFVDESVRRRSFDTTSFESFTGALTADIGTNITYAAQAQIEGVATLMRRWRDQVGEADWPGLYVVVLSIWTTSAPNQNSIIVKRFMDPVKADSHLIDLATAQPPADPVLVALDNLARIVADNIAAETVFPLNRQLADALKGPEDLVAREILAQLACPFRDTAARPR
ncbi:hypothetical protein [Streptomyces sp. SID3343]|uniref:hypothetical protein n=1 Tax=Streptomyces sp. SID3343 TaxID=2690260 RepID=UPI00136B3A73|nr:hypothetical protein [Streptomyces sp. SID3343]MYW04036.1 hypothetical protein [Streptomyces sp. SID3343]